MKKPLLYIFFFFLFSFSIEPGYCQEHISVKRISPEEFTAGNDYNVVVTIKKGSVVGFGKFSEVFPKGVTALQVDSKGGSFSFRNQQIKIVWASLPPDSVFSITYKINVSESEHTLYSKDIEGHFSFIENNEAKKVKIESGASSDSFKMDFEKEGYAKATIISYQVDGCTFILQLSDGKKLQPYNLSDEFKKDQLTVWVKYVPKKNVFNSCMAGQVVELSDIQLRK
jgi:hypothetical protein